MWRSSQKTLHRLYTLVRLEPMILGALVLCAMAVSAFIEIADDVMEGDTEQIDRRILLMMRQPGDLSDPIGPRWLEEMMRDFTGLGGIAILTLITLAAIFYLLMVRKGKSALYLLACAFFGTVMSNLLKMGFDRPRPDLVPHDTVVYTMSFPSGHSMMAAVIYLTIGAMLARVQPNHRLKIYIMALAVIITVLIGCSRVYLGVHWPSDVLAGWTAGGTCALVFWLGARLLEKRHKIES